MVSGIASQVRGSGPFLCAIHLISASVCSCFGLQAKNMQLRQNWKSKLSVRVCFFVVVMLWNELVARLQPSI